MDRLSHDLHRFFFEEKQPSHVRVADILTIGRVRIFGLLFAVLGLILALPLPLFGLAIPFGLMLLIGAIQLVMGAKSFWIPPGLAKKTIALKTVQGIIKPALPWLRRIEMFSCPRMLYLCNSFRGRLTMGVAIAIAAIFVIMQLPGLNTIAGIGILMTGWGLLVDDGAICLMGLAVCGVADIMGASHAIAFLGGGSNACEWF